jgi:hypothetical protein
VIQAARVARDIAHAPPCELARDAARSVSTARAAIRRADVVDQADVDDAFGLLMSAEAELTAGHPDVALGVSERAITATSEAQRTALRERGARAAAAEKEARERAARDRTRRLACERRRRLAEEKARLAWVERRYGAKAIDVTVEPAPPPPPPPSPSSDAPTPPPQEAPKTEEAAFAAASGTAAPQPSNSSEKPAV